MNSELALITKLIETKDINKILGTKVSNCFMVYGDIWSYVEEYYLKYRAVPTFEIVEKKFPAFEAEHKSDVSLDYLIDEVSSDYLGYKLEELITNAVKIIDDEKNPREALNYIFSKSSALGHQTDVVKDVDLVSDYWIRLKSLKKRIDLVDSGQQILGIPSGINYIDVIFGGWQPGDFVPLMGWTGAGKSWLASLFACNAWSLGKVPLYFSLEMDDKQLGYRIDTLLGKGTFSNTSLINGRNISADRYEQWAKNEFQDKHPFYIVTNEGLDEINQYTVQMKIEQYKPDLVILDYHSLFDDGKKGRTETERHKNLSKDFKRTAVRYGVPIIDVVAATMADGHGERPPELSEVAWSKQLAYDSDLVLSIVKNGQLITVEAKKSRRSDVFAFKLSWDLDSGTSTILEF